VQTFSGFVHVCPLNNIKHIVFFQICNAPVSNRQDGCG
jgi:hypothetical protein